MQLVRRESPEASLDGSFPSSQNDFFQRGNQRRKILRQDLPENIEVHLIVAMD